MEDKRLKNEFSQMHDQQLQFTKEDRQKVLEQIRHLEGNTQIKKQSFISLKKFAPAAVSLMVVGLCLLLFMPSIFTLKLNEQSFSSISNNGTNLTDNSGVAAQEEKVFTILLTVKDDNNRIPLNLLLSYNNEQKALKVISIPRDAYVPISEQNDGTPLYDKLTFAYEKGSGGAENVRAAVSKLFDVAIDYYAVVDLAAISTWINDENGIDYNLQEDMTVRAITEATFDLKKGTNLLNGEEVVALMMDATVGNNLNEGDLLNLMIAIMNKAKNEMTQVQFKGFVSQIESNVPLNHLIVNQIEINSYDSLSLTDGMVSTNVDGKYFVQFERQFIHSISKAFTTFD